MAGLATALGAPSASGQRQRMLVVVAARQCGCSDGTDRSTGDTQNMGESAGTGGTLA